MGSPIIETDIQGSIVVRPSYEIFFIEKNIIILPNCIN